MPDRYTASLSWKPIIVGVDGSPESARAAVTGSAIAEAAGTTCYLVHAVPDYWATPSVPQHSYSIAELNSTAIAHARTLVAGTLEAKVPSRLLHTLEVRVGRAPIVLAKVAAERGAELVVLGGKHHRGIARLMSSTLQHLVRTSHLPLLATDGASERITRVLAAVDLSHAARPVIAAGERFAALFGALLRIMHAVEPMPAIPGFPRDLDGDEWFRSVERLLETTVWPLIEAPGADRVIRRGRAAAAIVSEVSQWNADLVVVGSHGKDWVDRLLIGSTSERLLHLLPALTLVVPVPGPVTTDPSAATEPLPWEARGSRS